MNPEPFSWSKFLTGFSSAVGWAKAAAISIRILVVLCIVGVPFYSYKKGKSKGQELGYKEGYSQAITDHPPVTINGNNTQVNQNIVPKDNHFKMSVFPFRIGWCQ